MVWFNINKTSSTWLNHNFLYLLDVFASLFSLLALKSGTSKAFYPIYIVIINLAMVSLIIRPKIIEALVATGNLVKPSCQFEDVPW